MPNNGSSTVLWIAVLGGGIALAAGSGGSAPAPSSIPVPGSQGPTLRVYGPLGRPYPRVVEPSDIILIFREYRTDQWGPVGSTRIWTRYEQLHAANLLDDLHQQMNGQVVMVHIRPQWLGGSEYELEETDEVVPVWVRTDYVTAVGPSKTIDLARKSRLAELWFANGESLDIVQTLANAREMFPNAEHRTSRLG